MSKGVRLEGGGGDDDDVVDDDDDDEEDDDDDEEAFESDNACRCKQKVALNR